VAAEAREVFDVTGAGDTVIATLAVLVGAGQPLAEVPWANHAASVVVSKFGTASVSPGAGCMHDDLRRAAFLDRMA
jgi:bifunctional ADP-heptose synthase (sugar kinase/adenylyltransferase)